MREGREKQTDITEAQQAWEICAQLTAAWAGIHCFRARDQMEDQAAEAEEATRKTAETAGAIQRAGAQETLVFRRGPGKGQLLPILSRASTPEAAGEAGGMLAAKAGHQ